MLATDPVYSSNEFELKLKELLEVSTKVVTFNLDESGVPECSELEQFQNVDPSYAPPIRIHYEDVDNLQQDACVIGQLEDDDPFNMHCELQSFQDQQLKFTARDILPIYDATDKEANCILKSTGMAEETTKNTNFPKFLVRLFQKYCGTASCLHKGKQDNMKRLTKILRDFKERSTNNFNMRDIQRIFGQEDSVSDFCSLNRRKMMESIRVKLNLEVVKSNYLRNKISYMVAGKVFALRLRNRKLAKRIQSR